MTPTHFTDEVANSITNDLLLTDSQKKQMIRNLARLKETKVNILIAGATGCGKSSTINALFGSDKAKVGQGSNPETMEITQYEYENIVLFDSPGLGDGKEADVKHAKSITSKLYEKDSKGEMLIDLVLVILDGGSRDLGTSFEMINNVIIPNLGEDKKRLLVAINQADMAMKGRNWNKDKNSPEPELIKFLDEKVASTRKRIQEATGVDVEPIYYVAGYKDGNNVQYPYNLSKLLLCILQHTKAEKRAAFAQDLNQDKKMWADDDNLKDYRVEVQSTLWESIKDAISRGLDVLIDVGVTVVAKEVGKLLSKGFGKLVSKWF